MNYFEDENGLRYSAASLWHAAKGIKPIRVTLDSLGVNYEWLRCYVTPDDSPREIKKELNRVLNADLSFPIILTPEGTIADGFHRAVLAWLNGRKTISAIQLTKMPKHF